MYNRESLVLGYENAASAEKKDLISDLFSTVTTRCARHGVLLGRFISFLPETFKECSCSNLGLDVSFSIQANPTTHLAVPTFHLSP